MQYQELIDRLEKMAVSNFVDNSAARTAMQQAANAIKRLEHRVNTQELEIKTNGLDAHHRNRDLR
jgi:hypothetical protein